MDVRSALLATTALALVAAGCIGPGDVPRAKEHPPTVTPTPIVDTAPQPAPAPALHATRYNGSVSGAWAPGVVYVSPSAKHTFTVNVTNDTRALVIELAWKGGDKLSLKADVPSKYCTDSDPLGFLVTCPSPKPNEDGKSPARIVVTDAAALQRTGAWQVSVWAQGSVTEIDFTAAATTFFTAATPPQGYSALPPP